MKRYLLTILTTVSLVLFVGIGVIWVRSYQDFDSWSGVRQYDAADSMPDPPLIEIRLSCVRGGIDVAWMRKQGIRTMDLSRPWSYYVQPAMMPIQFGFSWTANLRYFSTRIWPLLFVAAVLPFFASIRFVFRRKRLTNHCAACDYDLRASPDRCPECGMFVKAI